MVLGRSERSPGLFRIASDAGVPWEPGEDAPFADDAYVRFVEAYEPWAKARDEALVRHIAQTPTFFRCHIPYGERAFLMARQLVWYVDEILVRDPVSIIVDGTREDVQKQKEELVQVLRVLWLFYGLLEEGYLLLGGRVAIPLLGTLPPSDEVQAMAGDPGIVAVLERELRLGIDLRNDEQGREWTLSQARLGGVFSMGFNAKGISGGGASPLFRVGEVLPAVDVEEYIRRLGADSLDQIRASLYPLRINRTLTLLDRASSLSSAAVFDAEADGVIVESAGRNLLDEERQVAVLGAFNLALPYLEGVPPERLLEVRREASGAFFEFRARMVDILKSAAKEDPEHTAELARLVVERDVIPTIPKLDAELRAAGVKAKVLGVGLPAVAATGALMGSILGVPLGILMPMLVGASARSLQAAADHEVEKARAATHPFYFLWLAQRGR